MDSAKENGDSVHIFANYSYLCTQNIKETTNMKQIYLTILLVLCALAGTATTAQAETITKTYLFSGSQNGRVSGLLL